MSRTGFSLRSKTAVHRHRYGNMNPVSVPVETNKGDKCLDIAAGDIVIMCPVTSGPLAMTAGVAYPAQKIATAGVASLDHYFLGVAMDTSVTGDSDDIMVATSGVFEFSCASSTTVVGQYARTSTAAEGGGASCDSFTVSPSTTASQAIGRVVSKGTTQTDVLVAIKSKVITDATFT